MTRRIKYFALAFGLSLPVGLTASAQAQASLPLGGTFTNSGTGDEAAVRTAAQTQISSKDTRFKSTEK